MIKELCASCEFLLDFVEPEPAFFVTHLLYHVEADPADVVDSDLVECAFDERPLERISEHLLVNIRRGVHCRYDSDRLQVLLPHDRIESIFPKVDYLTFVSPVVQSCAYGVYPISYPHAEKYLLHVLNVVIFQYL